MKLSTFFTGILACTNAFSISKNSQGGAATSNSDLASVNIDSQIKSLFSDNGPSPELMNFNLLDFSQQELEITATVRKARAISRDQNSELQLNGELASLFSEPDNSETGRKYDKGINISKWQGKINGPLVKGDGVNYAIIRASEGRTYTDPEFESNWNIIKNSGIKPAAYHVFRALTSTPEGQLGNIKQQTEKVGFNKNDDILAISVTSSVNRGATPDQMADNLNTLLGLLKNDGFSKLFIHCNYNDWTHHVSWQKYNFSEYPLWFSRWTEREPQVPKTWENEGWAFWQYSCDAQVAGIEGDVCVNKVNMTGITEGSTDLV